MSGWPSRLSRVFFGPKREDEFPAPDDIRWVRDLFFNAIFWQLPGLNVVSPKAGGLIVANALSVHEEAWKPNGDGNAPTFSAEGTGHYRVTYPAAVQDSDDNDVPPGLTRARAFAQSSTPRVVSCTVTNGVQVDIYVATDAGAPVDDSVWFEAF